jgi:hypothetical protein
MPEPSQREHLVSSRSAFNTSRPYSDAVNSSDQNTQKIGEQMQPQLAETATVVSNTNQNHNTAAAVQAATREPSATAKPPRTATALVALLMALIAVFGSSGTAQASANKCAGPLSLGSCVDVKGKKLHVDTIKSQVAPYVGTCPYGHSQVLIGGRHFADSNGGHDKPTACRTTRAERSPPVRGT